MVLVEQLGDDRWYVQLVDILKKTTFLVLL